MIQREEEPIEEKPKRKVKPQVDQSEALSQLYEYVIWCGNAINNLNIIVAQLQQGQFAQPQYQEPVIEEPVSAPASNTPTFSKRIRPVEEEPEKKVKPPWYRQKGIVFSIILGIGMIYLIYLFWMRSTGHSVTIPGIGKF